MTKKALEIDVSEITLQRIFDHYMACTYHGDKLEPHEVESIRHVFLAGSAAVLGAYDAVMAQLMEAEDALQAETDLNGDNSPRAIELDSLLDRIAQVQGDMMSTMMEEVDQCLEEQEAKLEHEEKSGVASDNFDLANWAPNTKGN